MTVTEKIADLLIKHIHNAISENEEAELKEWINQSEENRIAVEEFLDKKSLRLGISNTYLSKEKIWESVNAQVNYKQASPFYKRIYFKYAAAAAVLLFFTTVSYFLFNKPVKKEAFAIIHQTSKMNVAPGGHKAFLKLANGSTIILDNAKNGNLLQQGNTSIIKLADGELAYNNRDKPDTKQLIFNTITTPRGGQYQLTLPDGSKIWLNSATTLRFPIAFVGNKREVELTGEAYFEIAKNKAMPFIVTMNKTKIEVLGTHFNLNSYTDETKMQATLLEGQIKLTNANQSTLLIPGQQAQVDKEGKISLHKEVNLDEVMAWKNGYFSFVKADIKFVMRQISRWYDVDIAYEGAISKREFEGEMQRNLNLSQVLILLEKNKVHFKLEGKKLTVLP